LNDRKQLKKHLAPAIIGVELEGHYGRRNFPGSLGSMGRVMAILKNPYLLLRHDIRVGFSSPWMYFLMAFLFAYVVLTYYCWPTKGNTRVMVVDEVRGKGSEEILLKISEKGFEIREEPLLSRALRELKRDKISLVLHFTRKGTLECYTNAPAYRFRSGLREKIDAVVLFHLEELYKDMLVFFGHPELKLCLREVDLSRGTSSRKRNLLLNTVKITWDICAIWAFIFTVLVRKTLSRLLRKYSRWEFLAGKILSGLCFGMAFSAICFSAHILVGIEYKALSGVILCALWTSILGTMMGFSIGLFCLVFGKATERTFLAGFTSIFALHFIFEYTSGSETPVWALDPSVQGLVRWNPFFLLHGIQEWTQILGRSCLDWAVIKITRNLAIISSLEVMLCYLVLLRV
jgi:hypothetical protein